ncbi:LysR family transcriptional regulator [Brevibacillus borstelensis]|uniref:LysR family transcriptional regulator n=1 Tax=Brevibacillus borstelensis TaxID=45462 RepID=UPI0004F28D35|nr:LysR family transcriptional regulator [Brevibacillus borstelensis]KKX55455.1 LysR family transcriptional regulator [Brevibacillus borstelensis cifa_chp40]
MDIKQLRYFIAIAEEKQISAAAKRLHLAQPPLSQQLINLEKELGVALVVRHARGLELTEAGRILYKHAVKIASLVEESEIEVKEVGEGTKGTLSIGVNTLSSELLPSLLKQFQESYPHVTYKIQQNESDQLLKMVKEKAIELAIIRLPLELNDFSILHLKTEPLRFACSTRIPGSSGTITYEQICHHRLLLPSIEGLGVYHLILEEFSRRRLEPVILGECSDIAVLLQLVSSGFGATIVPEVVLRMHPGHDLQVFEIADATLAASSGVIWLKDYYLSKAAQNFLDLLRK